MPLSNRAPIDASGKLMVTTTTPTAAWPSLGGMTYHPTTGELAVIDAVPAVGDPWVGGIRFTNLGSMYVWSAALPAGVEYVGGIPVTDDGRVVVDGSGGAGGIVVGGWPIGSGGGVPVVGLSAQPIFWSVLTNTLVPVIAGNPTFTFTRATTAYVADHQGILRQAIANEARFVGARRVRNLVVNSQNFTDASWTKGNCTVSFGVTGPTGLADANTVTATAANASVVGQPGVTLPKVCVASLWMRRRTGTGPVRIITADGAHFDITAQLTGTWQRLAAPAVNAVLQAYSGMTIVTSGDAVDAAYQQQETVDGQSNQAPGDYVSVGVLAAPYHGNAIDGVRCFPTTNGNSVAGNVVTEATGALIPAATLLGYVAENAATNLCLQSQTFDNATWVKTNITPPTPNTQTAPDGTLTAEALVATGVNGTCLQSVTVTATTWCFSVYLKRLVGTGQVAITTDGVTFVDITSLLSASAWVRVDTNKALSAGAVTPGVRLAVSGDSVAIWGAQLE